MPTRRKGRPSGPPPPTATRGLADSRSIHSSPSGQGSPWRSIGRSSSMLTVSRMVANSVHTCPSRGPRTARAAASNTASSSVAAKAPEAQGDMDVGRDEHAGVVEIPQQRQARAGRDGCRSDRGRRARSTGSWAVGGMAVARARGRIHGVGPPSSRSLRAATSPSGGDQAKTPQGWPSTRGVAGATHPPHEEVQDAGEVPPGVVAGEAPAQVPVQGRDVQQGLQRVVGPLHLLGEGRRPVVPGGEGLSIRAEPVGLVVDDGKACRARRAARCAAPGRCCRSDTRGATIAGERSSRRPA